MAKTEGRAGKVKGTKPEKSTKPKAPKTAKAAKRQRAEDSLAGASTDPLPGVMNPIQARLIGDQLRGLAYLAKKLALVIREKKINTPFDPADIEGISQQCYALASDLQLVGDDGSNGG